MSRELFRDLPNRKPLLGKFLSGFPILDAPPEVRGHVLNGYELLVSNQSLHVFDFICSRALRKRRIASRGPPQGKQRVEKLGRLRSLLSALTLHELSNELADQQAIL